MRAGLFLVFGLAVAALLSTSCGGSKAAADCMIAMSQVNCPAGTRPEALSEGQDQFQADGSARTYTVNVGGSSNAQCRYVCVDLCPCGVSRIGGDGSVICVSCN